MKLSIVKLKVIVRRVLARNFGGIVEAWYAIKFRLTKFDKPPVIILTPGKVGSSSVYNSIKENTDFLVYHIHNLSKIGIENNTEANISSDRKSKPLHLIIAELLRNKLKGYSDKLYVITIVREPISREISEFFQNTEMVKTEVEGRGLEIDVEKAKDKVEEQLSLDICKGLKNWFDQEIVGNFGIDVFEEEFDRTKKYAVLIKGDCHLLVMKMEDLNDTFPEASKEFLDLDIPLYLQNSNISADKHYADAYKSIKNKIAIPPESLSRIFQSIYFQQFYKGMEKEVEGKWQQSL